MKLTRVVLAPEGAAPELADRVGHQDGAGAGGGGGGDRGGVRGVGHQHLVLPHCHLLALAGHVAHAVAGVHLAHQPDELALKML